MLSINILMIVPKTFLRKLFPDKPQSIYGKTLEWQPSDSNENYNSQDNSYGPHDISYCYNSNGFRCDEFNIESSIRIVFLGCSMTEGIGIRKEETWAYQLLENIKQDTNKDIPYWNLGLGGCGCDSITRSLYHYHDKLKPQIVFGFFPEFRKETFSFRYSDDWTPITATIKNNKEIRENYLLWDIRNIAYENEKNFSFIKIMLEKYNSIMIWQAWGEYYPYDFEYQIKTKFIFDKLARDKMHTGATNHKKFADAIYAEYRELILEKLRPFLQ